VAKREDIKNILLIGSGPIIIGQACEFDYSGTQAAKTLKELGYRVVLINSNPATIMTDPDFADKTYIEPIEEEYILKIIKKEKIDAILPTMGGQVALNVAVNMYDKGLLDGIEFLGANVEAIKKGEDRKLFKEAMIKIGVDVAKSVYAYSKEEALKCVDEIGFPMIVRASYTLGGAGSGVAYNIEEFESLIDVGLRESPVSEILIEESLLGWKEYEMEVIRDSKDNCIIVCSIENFDPMGVHTGDSITVAPALTLTDKEYQHMRNASFAILREVGVETGGSNVQFSIDPKTGRMIVIEMNPRVSRSSALASKATGYPIAKVATLLAVGYTLDEIKNDITGKSAAFEPVIDYIITKIPRFTFEKFPKAISTLDTSMKAVGEIMAMGVTFKESFLKALSSLETGISGFDKINEDINKIKSEIQRPNEKRFLYVMQGFREGLSKDEIFALSKIDPWFINELSEIYEVEKQIDENICDNLEVLKLAKKTGFSDESIMSLANITHKQLLQAKSEAGIELKYNQVDTCGGEFRANTSYYYSTYDNLNSQLPPLASQRVIDMDKKKVLIIGSGPNRIGQGIEFDYCCVHACYALKDMDVVSIMYNCNPETVSTDWDSSDILYFEPIDFERLYSVIQKEKPLGVIVHFGGQTPLKLAKQLDEWGVPILGTPAKVIELAEDRELFSNFIKSLKLNQPEHGTATNLAQACYIADKIGYPVLVRPSFVLGGSGMKIVYSQEELKEYMQLAINVSNEAPVLVDKFLTRAIEVDVDCVSDGKEVYIGAIMQHIEEAGIHSGDSICTTPPVSLSNKIQKEIESIVRKIALNLEVIGLMNMQLALVSEPNTNESKIYIIEVNPRASRTVPFVSKATSLPLAKIALRIMMGESLKDAIDFYDKAKIVYVDNGVYKPKLKGHISVKAPVFPFKKLSGSVMTLTPEMKSTGEVMGISSNFGESFAKSQASASNSLPTTNGGVFLSLSDDDKGFCVQIANDLIALGFSLCATKGTYNIIKQAGIECEHVLKVSEGRPNVADKFINNDICLAFNTSDGEGSSSQDGEEIRKVVLNTSTPYVTNVNGIMACIEALKIIKQNNGFAVKSLQDFLTI